MQSLAELKEATGTVEVGVGIKKVLLGIEKAKAEAGNVPSSLADIIAQQMAANRD
jgi:vesicle-fusing ATPase